jgi:hypothetical protein
MKMNAKFTQRISRRPMFEIGVGTNNQTNAAIPHTQMEKPDLLRRDVHLIHKWLKQFPMIARAIVTSRRSTSLSGRQFRSSKS